MPISASDKLEIFNGALLRMEERTLASLAENREPRRVLEHFWGASNKLVGYCLERGDWNFAMRSIEALPETGIDPAFGWEHAYLKPTDFRRLNSLSADARFGHTLTSESYADEAGYWFCDINPLYVRYVSDDDDYGFDSSKWNEAFRDFMELRLACLAVMRITSKQSLKNELDSDFEKAMKNAKSTDAMDEGTKFPPHGSWVKSRQGGWNRNRDRSRSIPS